LGRHWEGKEEGRWVLGGEDIIATTIQEQEASKGRNECQQNKREGDVERDTWKMAA
jgi:hypothetical protein